jgi:hypothetical protein
MEVDNIVFTGTIIASLNIKATLIYGFLNSNATTERAASFVDIPDGRSAAHSVGY